MPRHTIDRPHVLCVACCFAVREGPAQLPEFAEMLLGVLGERYPSAEVSGPAPLSLPLAVEVVALKPSLNGFLAKL